MSPSSAAYGYVLIACDEGAALLGGLQRAGANLNTGTFIAGVEGLASFQLVRDLGAGTFGRQPVSATRL